MSASQSPNAQRWYPSREQLKDPEATHRTLKQVLDQHYALVDRINAMAATQAQPAAGAPAGPPAGSGPADTMLLGLRVAPVDTQTLADGAVLTFSKANGNFRFI